MEPVSTSVQWEVHEEKTRTCFPLCHAACTRSKNRPETTYKIEKPNNYPKLFSISLIIWMGNNHTSQHLLQLSFGFWCSWLGWEKFPLNWVENIHGKYLFSKSLWTDSENNSFPAYFLTQQIQRSISYPPPFLSFSRTVAQSAVL